MMYTVTMGMPLLWVALCTTGVSGAVQREAGPCSLAAKAEVLLKKAVCMFS